MLLTMKDEFSLASAQRRYERLRQRLAQSQWISEGYAQDRGAGAGGPCYQWTRKVRKKTVSVALSKEQYEWLKTAIANWRSTQEILKEMQQISREVLFKTVPNPPRRKRLGKRVLGLI
jgi:cyclopropane fatty-acyl-phospholipid synthase-like methyltransferase